MEWGDHDTVGKSEIVESSETGKDVKKKEERDPYDKSSLVPEYRTPHFGIGYEVDPVKKSTFLRKQAFIEKRRLNREKLEGGFTNGKDDGQGAKMLLYGYVDDLLVKDVKFHQNSLTKDLTVDFSQSEFLTKINHPQMSSVPLLSQIAREKAIWPKHTTQKRKTIITICSRLKRNDGLMVRARLNSEDIDDQLATQLAKSMRHNIYLQHLMLHDNAITDVGVNELTQGARWHPSLHTLWLGANQISDLGARYISDLCRRNHNIKIVNISNRWPKGGDKDDVRTALHPHITYIGAECFAKSLRKCCGLTSLCLADQRVRDVGASALYEALKVSNIRNLSLKGNEITDASCAMLRVCLEGNPKLEKLDISKNNIGDKGAAEIAIGLCKNTILQALNLAHNMIDIEGMNRLCECTVSNHTLSTLLTVYNKCPDDRAERVIAMRSLALHNVSYNDDRHDKVLSAEQENLLKKKLNDEFWDDAGSDVDMSNVADTLASTTLDQHRMNEPLELGGSLSRGYSRSFKRMSSPWGSGIVGEKSELDNSSTTSSQTSRKNERTNTPKSPGVAVSGKRPLSRAATFTPEPSEQEYGVNYMGSDFKLLSPSKTSRGDSKGGSRGLTGTDDGSNTAGTNPLPALWEDGLFSPSLGESFMVPGQSFMAPGQSFSSDLGTSGSRRGNRTPKTPKLSSEIGKTLGIPHIASMGVMPVRSATTKYRDSAQNLIYLRVSTPDDPPEQRPYSLINIELDRQAERLRVEASRQTEEYKLDKINKIRYGPKFVQGRGAETRPPDQFWKVWRLIMQQRYPKGIDYAKGCTSTKVGFGGDTEEEKQNIEIFDKMNEELEKIKEKNKNKKSPSPTGRRGGLVAIESMKVVPSLKAKVTPGQALVMKRKLNDQRKKREQEKLEKRKAYDIAVVNSDPTGGRAMIRDMMGFRSNESFTKVVTSPSNGGLTKKISKDIPIVKPIKNIWAKDGV
jgi:Ran GTPase-activating protein (RanGAP) involved in mRNA processing and transport